MVARFLTAAVATVVALALTPTPAEAGHRRSGFNADVNFFVGGYPFPYRRHARFYGPGVIVNPFLFPDGRIGLNYLRHGSIFATDYVGYVDYGPYGSVRGFYTSTGGYYDNRGRYYRRYGHNYRRYGYRNSYRRGYHLGNGIYDLNGRYYRRYDDRYFGYDGRNDRQDEFDDQYSDRDFRNEPYRGGGIPPGGIQSEQFPGAPGAVPSEQFQAPTEPARGNASSDLDDRLDG